MAQSSTQPSYLFKFQGDENDPDQQSDSEEGNAKGEPQVTRVIGEKVD